MLGRHRHQHKQKGLPNKQKNSEKRQREIVEEKNIVFEREDRCDRWWVAEDKRREEKGIHWQYHH